MRVYYINTIELDESIDILALREKKYLGKGLYCYTDESKAIEVSKNYLNDYYITELEYDSDNELRFLDISKIDMKWLSYIKSVSSGIDFGYDLVLSSIPDWTIFDNVTESLLGNISYNMLLDRIGNFKNEFNHICFYSEECIKYLRIVRSYKA